MTTPIWPASLSAGDVLTDDWLNQLQQLVLALAGGTNGFSVEWTPTITTDNTAATFSSASGWYARAGAVVFGGFEFTFANPGVGQYMLSLPVDATFGKQTQVGSAEFFDFSAGTAWQGGLTVVSEGAGGAKVKMRGHTPQGLTFASNNPVAVATSDTFRGLLQYRLP